MPSHLCTGWPTTCGGRVLPRSAARSLRAAIPTTLLRPRLPTGWTPRITSCIIGLTLTASGAALGIHELHQSVDPFSRRRRRRSNRGWLHGTLWHRRNLRVGLTEHRHWRGCHHVRAPPFRPPRDKSCPARCVSWRILRFHGLAEGDLSRMHAVLGVAGNILSVADGGTQFEFRIFGPVRPSVRVAVPAGTLFPEWVLSLGCLLV